MFDDDSPDIGTSRRYLASTSAHSTPRGPEPRGALQVWLTTVPERSLIDTVPPCRCVKRSGNGVGCWSNTTLSCKAPINGSSSLASAICSQVKLRSATEAATKYTTLCAAPIRSRGWAWLPQSFICAAEMVMLSTSRGSTLPSIAAIAAASAIA